MSIFSGDWKEYWNDMKMEDTGSHYSYVVCDDIGESSITQGGAFEELLDRFDDLHAEF